MEGGGRGRRVERGKRKRRQINRKIDTLGVIGKVKGDTLMGRWALRLLLEVLEVVLWLG